MIVLLAAANANAQQELDVLQKWMQYSDAPNSLYHHLAAEAFVHLEKRAEEVSALQSPTQWEQRRLWLRKTLQEAVGAFPEKTPLHVKVTATLKKDGFRVENIVYESQPGFFVTGSLFVPELKKGEKAPAVLYCSGHSATGYRSAVYQHVILNLVKKGFVVFAFDPVGQGERLEYYDAATKRSKHKWPSNEHSYPGAQLFMNGRTLAMYMIWDGIRAVDLLLSRKEVDASRIAVTGRSGGGTQSAYIAAFDERIKVAAPENYITSFTRLFQSIGPQDAEQNFPGGIARGLDMGDLLMVRAPKPCLMITTSRDMFSIQGAQESAREVAAMYAALDGKENFQMVTDDAPHASTKKNREALYAFLQQHLGRPGTAVDEDVQPLSAKELQVTPTGQLSTSLKGETLFSLHLVQAKQQHARLENARKQPSYIPAMLDSARILSGYRAPAVAASPVFTGRLRKEGYVIEKYFIKGEGDYVVPYILMKPGNAGGKAVIYLHPAGKAKDAGAGGQMEWLVKQGFTVLAPDMIGTGETGPGIFQGDSFIDSISYNLWFAAVQTGRSITGIRAGDVARLAGVLAQNGVKEISGLAQEHMAPVLLHAVAFDKNISRVALVHPSASWYNILSSRTYEPMLIQSAVAGANGVYDLPDLAASLAPKKLLIAGEMDDVSFLQNIYRQQHAEDRLKTVPLADVQNALLWWLND
ncbi:MULTISPECIES: alpha/beta hydrolase [Chitinophaga]|nr:acetylxylan esterase [Chitinophaga chungangae]